MGGLVLRQHAFALLAIRLGLLLWVVRYSDISFVLHGKEVIRGVFKVTKRSEKSYCYEVEKETAAQFRLGRCL